MLYYPTDFLNVQIINSHKHFSVITISLKSGLRELVTFIFPFRGHSLHLELNYNQFRFPSVHSPEFQYYKLVDFSYAELFVSSLWPLIHAMYTLAQLVPKI